MNNLRFRIFRSLDIFLATVITSALVIAVVKFNIFATIDGDIHLNWSYFWGKQVLEGQLFPKWFDAAFDGLGNTSFIFYPPLMRVTTLPFAILQLSPTLQIKGAIIILLLLNTYGVIKLSRFLFQSNL